MILGIDVSTYFEELAANAKYYDNDKEVDPLDMFTKNGVNYMRIRVWNDPYNEDGKPYLGGTCDVDNFIKLSKLALSKGYKILLDLHYSDFWADPGKQMLPKKWVNKSLEEVSKLLYDFTIDTLTKAKNEGIDIELIQIGNEITNGICWPIGRLIEHESGPRTNYENLAVLLKSGIKAAKEIFPNVKTILHLERSYDQVVYKEFFPISFKIISIVFGIAFSTGSVKPISTSGVGTSAGLQPTITTSHLFCEISRRGSSTVIP